MLSLLEFRPSSYAALFHKPQNGLNLVLGWIQVDWLDDQRVRLVMFEK